jgi:hypothetical protein
MFTFKSFAQIVEEVSGAIQQRAEGDTRPLRDVSSLSVMGALVRAFAAGLVSAWDQLRSLREGFYVSTAYGTLLDDRLGDLGMLRNPGLQARGFVLARSLSADTTSVGIEEGTLLSTQTVPTLDFLVVSTATYSGTEQAVEIEAVQSGLAYNLPAGTRLYTSSTALQDMRFEVGSTRLDGLAQGDLLGGLNAETDADYALRFPYYLQGLPRSTYGAVRQALLGTPGVSGLVLENAKPGPGYVRIHVASSSATVSQGTRDAIAATLLDWGPAGLGYVIKAVQIKTIPVTLRVVVTTAYSLSAVEIQQRVAALMARLSQQRLEENLMGVSLFHSELVAAVRDELNLAPTEDVVVIAPETPETTAGPQQVLNLSPVSVEVFFRSV